MGCRGKAACHMPGGCRRKVVTQKRQETAPRTHAAFLPERMVHASVTVSAAQAPFRACLTHTLATTRSVQCEHTDTTETNRPGQDEQEAGFYQTKRKDKTHLPTQTCLPLCVSSGQHSFSPEGPKPLASCHQTRKQNKQRSRSKPFTGCSTRHTQHRRKGSAPN